MDLKLGEIVDGKYRIERKLGAGGMGAVFAARHLELGELVALKVMLPTADGTGASSRFHREARAASRLRGEHVVRVLDAGRFHDGAPYIVFEYVDGPDLRAVLRKRGPLPVVEAADAIIQACAGVAEAHALGMVHRDISLKNILLTQRPNGTPLVKILDFGVVKLAEGAVEEGLSITATATDVLIGSAHYMSPEQVQMSSKVDARADVWSLGVCLYALLSGRHPFEGMTVSEILAQITSRPPQPIRDLRGDVPEPVANAVERALEKSLTRRFANVAELARALGDAIGDARGAERVESMLGSAKVPAVAARSAPLAEPEPMTRVTAEWAAEPASVTRASANDASEAATLVTPRAEPIAPSLVGTGPPTPPRRARAWPLFALGAALAFAVGAVAATRPRSPAPSSPVDVSPTTRDAEPPTAASALAASSISMPEVPPALSHAPAAVRLSASGASKPRRPTEPPRPKPTGSGSEPGPYDRF